MTGASRAAPRATDGSPLATHLPALSWCLYAFFGERSDGPPSLAPLSQFAVPLVAAGEIAAWLAGVGGATFVPLECAMLAAWFCAPAWMLPLHYLAPLLRDVFSPAGGSLLLREQRVTVTWAVEVSVGLLVPATVLLNLAVRAVTWPHLSGAGALGGPSTFWSLNVLGALIYILFTPATIAFLAVVVLVCTLHVAELELLVHHWQRRTRHAFLEAPPPEARWALLCLRCPRRVRRSVGLARCCGGARSAVWRLYSLAWGAAPSAAAAAGGCDEEGALSSAAVGANASLALPAQQDDDERLGRPMTVLSSAAVQGDRFVEPTLDLIIESFTSTRRSVQLTSGTLGFQIAVVLAVCPAAMLAILAKAFSAQPVSTFPTGDTNYLLPFLFYAVSCIIVFPVVGINRRWRRAEDALSQNVIMYTETEQLRLMALLSRNPIELSLVGLPATVATGSLFMLAMTVLLLLSAYFFARSVGPCSGACAAV